jgi:hypothetical protein
MSKRSRLQGRIEGLEALIEVSAVDIGNQVKAIKALGTEAVDLYKQFNQNFGEIMVGKIKAKVPKDSGSLASSIRSAKLQDGVVIRVGTPAKHPYARLVEFGGYNPYTTTIRKSIGSKNFGATATLKVRNPLSRKLWKAQRKEGYFFYPSIKEELPKFQADYIKALDNLVESLYSRFS